MARKESTNTEGQITALTKLPLSRVKKAWKETVIPKMKEQFGYKSVMQVPRIDKIVINMGIGPNQGDKSLENGMRDLALIAGQRPVATIARVAVSNFKIREGMKIGCKVTLRGVKALHFFDKLTTVVLPRIRDFQGLSANSFDGRGNYALGLKEQLVFPEIPYESFDRMRGMDIIICTTAKNDEESRAFLKMMGLPLKEK